MGAQLSTPLADIVKRAAQLPVTDQRETALKDRFADATDAIFVLVDCSGSMLDRIGDTKANKWEHARIAVEDVLIHCPKVRIVAFNYSVAELKRATEMPQAAGGTNLAAGLEYAAAFRPRKTVVISDGIPDSEAAAIEAARRMTGVIDTIYCGPDGHPAIQFLRSLNRLSGGRHTTWQGRQELTGAVRALIGASAIAL